MSTNLRLVVKFLSSVLLGAWQRVLNVSALILSGLLSSNIVPHPHADLILATSSTAAPSAYAPSDADPYDSGYEGDDEWEPNSISWR